MSCGRAGRWHPLAGCHSCCPLLLQKHWPPGTQCIAKHDHSKPKARELAFHKGDIITIIEACEVSHRAHHGDTSGGH